MKTLRTATCLMALVAWASASHADCPTNFVRFYGLEFHPTTPTYDGPFSGSDLTYNLPAGTIRATVSAPWYSSYQNAVRVSDDYWLEGPASVDPIPFTVSLHVTGSAQSSEMKTPNYCTTSGLQGRLSSDAAEQSAFLSASNCSGTLTTDQTISLPLQKLPGEVFNVGMDAFTTAFGGSATMNGVLTFSVPPQYGIRSCQGFHLLPTPASIRSWGSIKVAYR